MARCESTRDVNAASTMLGPVLGPALDRSRASVQCRLEDGHDGPHKGTVCPFPGFSDEQVTWPNPAVVVVDDRGGLGFRILELWAFLAVHDDGDEGLVAAPLGGMTMPLVAADPARVESLRDVARTLAKVTGKRIVLARFQGRVDQEVIEP